MSRNQSAAVNYGMMCACARECVPNILGDVHTYVCMYICTVCTHIHTYTHRNMYIYVRTHTYVQSHTYIHIDKFTQTYAMLYKGLVEWTTHDAETLTLLLQTSPQCPCPPYIVAGDRSQYVSVHTGSQNWIKPT